MVNALTKQLVQKAWLAQVMANVSKTNAIKDREFSMMDHVNTVVNLGQMDKLLIQVIHTIASL